MRAKFEAYFRSEISQGASLYKCVGIVGTDLRDNPAHLIGMPSMISIGHDFLVIQGFFPLGLLRYNSG